MGWFRDVRHTRTVIKIAVPPVHSIRRVIPRLRVVKPRHGTGHGRTFQMSAAYSAMVRSLENLPEYATFRIVLLAEMLAQKTVEISSGIRSFRAAGTPAGEDRPQRRPGAGRAGLRPLHRLVLRAGRGPGMTNRTKTVIRMAGLLQDSFDDTYPLFTSGNLSCSRRTAHTAAG
jgi:hypothetical protein